MSEEGGSSGVGPFLFGLGIGAALGFLFAPEPGAAARTKLGRRLRELAAEKVGELEKLVELGDDEGAPRSTTRAVLARRLADAKRRRKESSSSA